MIRKILEFSVLKIKKRKIILDKSISNRYLMGLIYQQTVSLLRGVLKLNKLVFVGPSVKFSSKANIQCANGVSFGSYSIIDGLGIHGIDIGNGSSIGAFSILKVSGTLSDVGHGINIGSNVGIGDFAHIGGAGGVIIGDNTIAGAYLSIHPENHIFENKAILIREQGVTRKGIEVGSNCWIGAKVTLLDGSKIGNGSIVAAGAVVNGSFPDNVVIGGIPAKILKYRQ